MLKALGVRRDVDLVQDRDDPAGPRSQSMGRQPYRRRRIDQPDHQFGLAGPRQCPAHALGLHRAFGLAQARSVCEDHRQPAEIEVHLDHVARGAGLFAHDRNIALGQRIQQTRLARIGRPGDDDSHAVA